MPVIPVIQRRMSIPGEGPNVLQDVGSAGMVGNAIANLGKTGMNAVDELVPIIARRNEEMRQQNNAMAVLKAQNAIDSDMRAFKQTYDIEANKGNFDPAGLQDFTKTTVDKFKTDLDTNYLEKVSDPQQRIHIETYRNAAINHVLDHTSVYQANARKDFAKVETLKSTDLAAQNARDGVMDLETAIKANREKLGILHVTGAVSAADMEEVIIKADRQIAEASIDGLIVRDPSRAVAEIKSGKYNQFLTEERYRYYQNKAETLNQKKIEEEKETNAYAAASEAWPDAKQAMIEVRKPEFMKKYGLTINQSQNIAQQFVAIGAERERETKKLQENNIGVIQTVALTNPVKALKLVQTAEDVDPKDALALHNSLESHLRQMSLMSAQEKSLRLDLEDKIKASIKSKILSGFYKSEKDVTNAVIAEGLSNTSGFIDDALGTFRGVKKDSGAVNFFQQAKEDWGLLISTTKGPNRKRELKEMEPKMLETLRLKMEADGLRISDPKVSEIYKSIRKELTETSFQKAVGAIGSFFGGSSGDSFVAPKQVQSPVSVSTVMDEATARKRLLEKGVKGADQEKWIKRYREEGVIK